MWIERAHCCNVQESAQVPPLPQGSSVVDFLAVTPVMRKRLQLSMVLLEHNESDYRYVRHYFVDRQPRTGPERLRWAAEHLDKDKFWAVPRAGGMWLRHWPRTAPLIWLISG